MRGTYQVWRHAHFVAAGAGAVQERAFGAGAGAGQENDFVAALAKALAGQQRILLRSADDEAGDDVQNPHGCRII